MVFKDSLFGRHRIERLKALIGSFAVFFLKCFRNHEFFLTILSWALPNLFARHGVFFHGFSHFKGGVYANTIVSVQHFGVHSTHRSADDKVGIVFFYLLFQEIDSL